MTDGIPVTIPLGFLVLAGMLCWFWVRTPGKWPLKLFMTGFLLFYSLEVYDALDSYRGWPTGERIPQRSILYSAIAREPNPATGDKGAIFLFVVPLNMDDPDPFSYRPRSGEPRVYRIPYSRSMHEQADGAAKAGRPMLLVRDGVQGGGGQGEGGGDENQQTYGEDEGGGFHLEDLPPPNLPPKDPQGH